MINIKKNNPYLFFIIGVIAVIFYYVFSGIQIHKDIAIFDRTEISGRLLTITHVKRIVKITLVNNVQKEYTFDPFQLDGEEFYDVASPSDSIYKNAWGDTVKLYHGNKVYGFTYLK